MYFLILSKIVLLCMGWIFSVGGGIQNGKHAAKRGQESAIEGKEGIFIGLLLLLIAFFLPTK